MLEKIGLIYLQIKHKLMNLTTYHYLIPFIVSFILFSWNEYRLYKIGRVDYKCLINSISLLLIGYITVIICHLMLN